MPRGDGTGPAGLGPMTGRTAGYCAGYSVPGFANPVAGRGYGFGFGFGHGVNRGRMGRGHRNWDYATGLTGWQRHPGFGYPVQAPYGPAVPPYAQSYAPTKEQEIEALKGQSKYLENELSVIQKRLKELEKENVNK